MSDVPIIEFVQPQCPPSNDSHTLGFSCLPPAGPSRLPVASRCLRRGGGESRNAQVKCLAWRLDANKLLCGLASGEVSVYNGSTLESDDLKRVLAASGEICAIAPITRADLLLLGDSAGKVHFITHKFAPLKTATLYQQRDVCYALSVNSAETAAVAGIKASNPVLLDLETQSSVAHFADLGFATTCLEWHPRRALVAAGSSTNQVQLWDPRQATPAGTPAAIAGSFGVHGTVTCVKWHPTNDFTFATAGQDQLISVWDIRFRGQTDWKPVDILKTTPSKIATSSSASTLPLSFMAGSRMAAKGEPCPWCRLSGSTPAVAMLRDFDAVRCHPTALAWHHEDLMTVGDSAGCISFLRVSDRTTVARVDSSQQRSTAGGWGAPNIEDLKWHSDGKTLASASNHGVSFWTLHRIWDTLCDPVTCGHSIHLNF